MAVPATPARRLHLRIEGRVQGVGFRVTTCEVAKNFPVTGFVRNQSDGSVEIEAEGREEILLNFHRALRACRVWRFVTAEHLSWSEARGTRTDFTISLP